MDFSNTDGDTFTNLVIKAMLETPSSASKHVLFEEAINDITRNIRRDASEPDVRLKSFMLQTTFVSICKRRW